jgi:hypothetical protein
MVTSRRLQTIRVPRTLDRDLHCSAGFGAAGVGHSPDSRRRSSVVDTAAPQQVELGVRGQALSPRAVAGGGLVSGLDTPFMSDAARQDTAFLEPLIDVGAVGLSDSRPRALGCLWLLASATFCSCSVASRPLSGAAARRVWWPRLRAAFRSAASCSHSSRRRLPLRCRRDQRRAAWHGPANRRAARPRDLLCAAELPLASATDDAHHIIDEACSSSSTFVLQSTDHRSQRCSLSSSPLASLSSRRNSKCRSTLRSWISTALLVRTDKRQGVANEKKKKKKKHFFVLFRLSS